MIVSRAHTHLHMPNNDLGQPLNAVWRYTLSSTSTPIRYYCADQGFEKAPSPVTSVISSKHMPKEAWEPSRPIWQGKIHMATAPAHRSRVVEAHSRHSTDKCKPHDWLEQKRLNRP